ncbi:MAG: hypothetical protein DGJ47_000513 [Rickettsiaceae bacterium]
MVKKEKKSLSMLKIKQVVSSIGKSPIQKKTLIGLGLRKINHEKTLEDTPSIRGMITKVKHLVQVQSL